MTTETKNTTAIERRIARRKIQADTLNELADLVERVLSADGTVLREAATELLIGNTDIVLAQPWATDKVDAHALDVFQRAIDAKPATAPIVTDAMVDRALDGWGQWWAGYVGKTTNDTVRAAMRHALTQALEARGNG